MLWMKACLKQEDMCICLFEKYCYIQSMVIQKIWPLKCGCIQGIN